MLRSAIYGLDKASERPFGRNTKAAEDRGVGAQDHEDAWMSTASKHYAEEYTKDNHLVYGGGGGEMSEDNDTTTLGSRASNNS